MAVVKCPNCGTEISVVEKKTGLWWGIGCLIAALGLPVLVSIVAMLAAIAIPNFLRARDMSQQTACVANMKMLQAAKERVLADKGYKPGTPISEQEVSGALGRPFSSVRCPKGGTYTLSPAGQDPVCSAHGSLTQAREHRNGRWPEPAVER